MDWTTCKYVPFVSLLVLACVRVVTIAVAMRVLLINHSLSVLCTSPGAARMFEAHKADNPSAVVELLPHGTLLGTRRAFVEAALFAAACPTSEA